MVVARRTSTGDGTTLSATGSLTRTITVPKAAGSGVGGHGGMGGGMGAGMGGRRRGGFGNEDGFPGGGGSAAATRTNVNVTTHVTISAHFAADGTLTSGTIVETTSGTDDQNAVTTRSWDLERMR